MGKIIDQIIDKPWPWYVGGPLIGVFVILLLVVKRKQFGISSSLVYICSGISPKKSVYLKENASKSAWQFWFVIGLIAGGLILSISGTNHDVLISPGTREKLSEFGIISFKGYVPAELFNSSMGSLSILLFGGFLIGFGARYANGCTAGHAIMGCAQLAPSSILATTGFFIGGLLSTYFIIPLILTP